MTEDQYQAARKVLQTANYLRGEITTAKGEVAKWTKIEDSFRQNLQPTRADGAKKMLEKAMKRLADARKRFSDMKLPGEDVGPGVKWVAAIDNDSFNYLPKKINAVDFEKAETEGLELFLTLEACQNECDRQNSL